MTDHNGSPVALAKIEVDGSSHIVYSNPSGAYWRMLPEGPHTLSISAKNYYSLKKLVNVSNTLQGELIILKISKDETILGLPRTIFVLVTGKNFHYILLYII